MHPSAGPQCPLCKAEVSRKIRKDTRTGGGKGRNLSWLKSGSKVMSHFYLFFFLFCVVFFSFFSIFPMPFLCESVVKACAFISRRCRARPGCVYFWYLALRFWLWYITHPRPYGTNRGVREPSLRRQSVIWNPPLLCAGSCAGLVTCSTAWRKSHHSSPGLHLRPGTRGGGGGRGGRKRQPEKERKWEKSQWK